MSQNKEGSISSTEMLKDFQLLVQSIDSLFLFQSLHIKKGLNNQAVFPQSP